VVLREDILLAKTATVDSLVQSRNEITNKDMIPQTNLPPVFLAAQPFFSNHQLSPMINSTSQERVLPNPSGLLVGSVSGEYPHRPRI
jgi:hypothetical protein